MHSAALPPIQPPVSELDRRHPRFLEYSRYRSSMIVLLVQAAAFSDWLAQEERRAREAWAPEHPRRPEFMQWMHDHRGGARRCPAGDFPENFRYWLDGGRW